MTKRILITGCMGYLGTELCKLFSGESRKYQIIGIDDKFYSERVNQLNKWNIKFHQIGLLESDRLKKICNNIDAVFHLAGITDVAYISSEINPEKEKKIISVGITGTENIIKYTSKNCQIFFPSTHVIFEGLTRTKKNISENEMPVPILTYAKTKVQNESQIISSKKNYVIFRLGSVYGYSGDNTRVNIMPNLFSKLSALNSTINLYSGGLQLKSLVSVIDVVRCFKFAFDNKIKNQIFNLSNENTSVKGVAQLIKKINPLVKVKINNYPIPNRGYTLSNKKILNAGFKFLYNLEDSLKEMFKNWKFNDNSEELEYKIHGKDKFFDKRGLISNYELTEPINLIGLIYSNKNSLRANHYHPVQEQKVLLIKGQYISIYQDLLNANNLKVTHVVNEGDCIVTKPNVAHTMVFTKDSILLNLVRGERNHDNYGITHTIPYKLVSKKEKKDLLNYYKLECRCCGSTKLRRVISLGYQPPANNLVKEKGKKSDTYPLEMNYCEECFNCQLSFVVNPNKLFTNYLYTSSTSSSFKKHFENAAKKYIKMFKMKSETSGILDIGSNDGIGLKPFLDIGFKNILGIEPAKNIADIANKNGIKTINHFMDQKIIEKIKFKPKLILASNVYAHTDKLDDMTKCISHLMNKESIFIIECQYLIDMLLDCSFDNIYHEHVNYWCITSLKSYLSKFNLNIFRVEKIKTHGGSVRVFITKNDKIKIEFNVKKILNEEKSLGILNFKIYEKFREKVEKSKINFMQNINKIGKNNLVIGYGAPAKASTLLNYFNAGKYIKFIIDDNKLKHNKLIPGVNIPIVKNKKKYLKNSVMIVFAWNFFNDIKKNNKKISKKIINCRKLMN